MVVGLIFDTFSIICFSVFCEDNSAAAAECDRIPQGPNAGARKPSPAYLAESLVEAREPLFFFCQLENVQPVSHHGLAEVRDELGRVKRRWLHTPDVLRPALLNAHQVLGWPPRLA